MSGDYLNEPLTQREYSDWQGVSDKKIEGNRTSRYILHSLTVFSSLLHPVNCRTRTEEVSGTIKETNVYEHGIHSTT